VVRKYLQINANPEKGPIDIAFEQMDPDGSVHAETPLVAMPPEC
jgi:hypothetical protein